MGDAVSHTSQARPNRRAATPGSYSFGLHLQLLRETDEWESNRDLGLAELNRDVTIELLERQLP